MPFFLGYIISWYYIFITIELNPYVVRESLLKSESGPQDFSYFYLFLFPSPLSVPSGDALCFLFRGNVYIFRKDKSALVVLCLWSPMNVQIKNKEKNNRRHRLMIHQAFISVTKWYLWIFVFIYAN